MQSRTTPAGPDLSAKLRTALQRIARLESASGPAAVSLSTWGAGVPLGAADGWQSLGGNPVPRTQAGVLWADLWAEIDGDTVAELRLAAPDLAAQGPAVTAEAGTATMVRCRIAMPDTWAPGTSSPILWQARRTYGTGPVTVALVRAWQI
ncbi:hypothetical protein GCM10022221_68620 [Actinocorallia aurea]